MPVIEADNLSFAYTPHGSRALDSLTFKVNKGDVLGIFGENGSGKSTLIKHLNGILASTSGSLKIVGKDVSHRKNRNELWKKVGVVFQFPEQQLFEATVYQEVAFGLKNMKIRKEEIRSRVLSALEKVGLNDQSIENVSPLSLSGGMRRRVAIASVLAMNPEILVLDEATVGLDFQGREKILSLIKKVQEDGQMTVILVSHQLRELISTCSHLAILKEGKLLAFGNTRDVLLDEKVQQIYRPMYPDDMQLLFNLANRCEDVNDQCIHFHEIEDELHKLLVRGYQDAHA